MAVFADAGFKTASISAGTHRPDVFERMTADHRRLRFLLDRLRNSPAGAPALPRVFDLLCDALEGYAAASEQSLYAEVLVRAATDDKWPARYAVSVHDMTELLIFELSGMPLAGEDWYAGLRQLSGYLEEHFRVEADDVIPLARSLFGGVEADRLGERYAEVKRDWIDRFGRQPAAAQPQPLKPSKCSGTSSAAKRPDNVVSFTH